MIKNFTTAGAGVSQAQNLVQHKKKREIDFSEMRIGGKNLIHYKPNNWLKSFEHLFSPFIAFNFLFLLFVLDRKGWLKIVKITDACNLIHILNVEGLTYQFEKKGIFYYFKIIKND